MTAVAAPAGYLVSREIGIDAGHRVTDHQSKCRNLHGHRYGIQAWCRGRLFASGEQSGMCSISAFSRRK